MAALTITSGYAAAPTLTEDGGQPVGDNQNSRTAGPRGGILLDNFHLIQKLGRFDRERIPERVVHARGVGAHGQFVSYDDWSKFTKADLFSSQGKTTPVFLRISTVIHPKGSPEQLRDPRGFAVKFYTEQGNWDLVGNNLPIFFIRDAMKFPDMVHSLKPSPITNQQDPNRFFDFFSHVPESTHMLTILYSDQGTPTNLRQMDGFGVHAFKWVNAAGDVTYVKFNWRSMQGLNPATAEEAAAASAKNHSGMTADLYDSINRGQYPEWELGVQMLKPDQLDDFDFDPLDATKIWTGVPEIKVGKMTINRVPSNFFQSTEQVAFSPGMVVPGIEPSEDRLLQGRLFSYADTQRHRIGANYLTLPINRPQVETVNINQDGDMNMGATTSDVNFQPSAMPDTPREEESYEYSQAPLSSQVVQQRIAKTLNFQQAGELYRSFDKDAQANLVKNFAGDLSQVKNRQIKLRILSFLTQSDPEYGERVTAAVGESADDVQRMITANENVEPTRWTKIELPDAAQADKATIHNSSVAPIRYQTRAGGSAWSKTFTLMPRQSHRYDAALDVRVVDKQVGAAQSVTLGKLVDLSEADGDK
ncbi:probable catalase hydroperoxidase hpii oxidoreductase protein [Blastopirellula marina DSM 3645]|uniref:Catalase n=1 Tax=Blastopirellula marina DSM 3645 TaxID=314230 RepID=A4A1M4_9BACT|nr:probable catalase hydroperoxidase hpii oxidoreductase protein [Blastopirellula marina DSM 3645]